MSQQFSKMSSSSSGVRREERGYPVVLATGTRHRRPGRRTRRAGRGSLMLEGRRTQETERQETLASSFSRMLSSSSGRFLTRIGLSHLKPVEHLFQTVICGSAKDIQPGDVLLFDIVEKEGFKHAALCYEPGMVIHLVGVGDNPLETQEGDVLVEGTAHILKERTLYKVLRPKIPISLKKLKKKAVAAANERHTYNLLNNNCIHFVLDLLCMRDKYDEVHTQDFFSLSAASQLLLQ